MEESRPIRVLVLDDSPSTVDGIGLLINSSRGLTSISPSNGSDSVETTLERLRPDVVLSSPEFLARNTMKSPRKFSFTIPATRFLAFCTKRQMLSATALIEQGYAGAVCRTVPTQKLLRAITVIGIGGHFFDVAEPEIDLFPLQQGGEGTAPARKMGLTLREESVLRRVAMGRAIKEIAAEANLSQKTVETYKARAARKLDLNNRSEIVQYAIDKGWLTP
jgi:DNA-binding NarL/FixJ family response regulator